MTSFPDLPELDAPLKVGTAVFMTDFFRCSVNNMQSITANRKMMLHLLRPALAELGWNCVESFASADGGAINTQGIMNALDLPTDVSGWAAATSTVLPEEIDSFLPEVLVADVVLSFGLTPALASVLNRHGIPYLDIEVSPIRFCADLFWCARTNHTRIRSALETIAVPDDFFWTEAAYLSAALAWRGLGSIGEPSKDYGVFVGQSSMDLALVHDGKIRRADEFVTETLEYFSDVSEILYAPHPYDTAAERFAKLKEVVNRIELTTEKTYRLLCADNVVKVMAISSSVLEESRYFGKPSKRLVTPDRDCISAAIEVAHEIAGLPFWRYVGGVGNEPRRNASSPRTIASVFGMRWGLDGLI